MHTVLPQLWHEAWAADTPDTEQSVHERNLFMVPWTQAAFGRSRFARQALWTLLRNCGSRDQSTGQAAAKDALFVQEFPRLLPSPEACNAAVLLLLELTARCDETPRALLPAWLGFSVVEVGQDGGPCLYRARSSVGGLVMAFRGLRLSRRSDACALLTVFLKRRRLSARQLTMLTAAWRMLQACGWMQQQRKEALLLTGFSLGASDACFVALALKALLGPATPAAAAIRVMGFEDPGSAPQVLRALRQPATQQCLAAAVGVPHHAQTWTEALTCNGPVLTPAAQVRAAFIWQGSSSTCTDGAKYWTGGTLAVEVRPVEAFQAAQSQPYGIQQLPETYQQDVAQHLMWNFARRMRRRFDEDEPWACVDPLDASAQSAWRRRWATHGGARVTIMLWKTRAARLSVLALLLVVVAVLCTLLLRR